MRRCADCSHRLDVRTILRLGGAHVAEKLSYQCAHPNCGIYLRTHYFSGKTAPHDCPLRREDKLSRNGMLPGAEGGS